MRVTAGWIAVALALALAGCASVGQSPTKRPAKPSTPASDHVTTSLRPGDRVTMRSGLTVTVPQGWMGNRIVWSFRGASDDASIESVLVRTTVPVTRITDLSRVILESDADLRTPQWRGRLVTFATAPGLKADWFQAGGQLSANGTRWVVVEVQKPGSQPGLVDIGPISGDPKQAIRKVWNDLQLQGMALPAGWQ